MKAGCLAFLVAAGLLSGCGPTPEEQRATDQQKCGGFGFAQGTDAFAHCMMTVTQQREAQDAADRRAAAARDAADKRARDAAQADKDKADRDAWNRRTGQGVYSSSPSSSSPSTSSSFASPSPVDAVRDSIDRDMRKIEGSE